MKSIDELEAEVQIEDLADEELEQHDEVAHDEREAGKADGDD